MATPARAATIFISYRRMDSTESAGRIYDRLAERYGRERVFKDVDSIPPGVAFLEYIAESLEQSDVALIIIGPRWLNASTGFAQRRLDDAADFVRVEIETALRLGVAVIPVLIGGATLPPVRRLPESLRPLLRQNGVSVRPDPDFNNDMQRIYAAIDYWQGRPRRSQTPMAPAAPAPTLAPAATPTPDPTPATSMAAQAMSTPAAPAEAMPAQAAAERPSPAIATALAEKKPAPRRPARLGPILASVSALIVLALSVGLLHSFAPSLFTRPNVAATETANASTREAQGASATLTAEAKLLTQPYIPSGVGPCDKVDAPRTRYGQPYWSWYPVGGVACNDGKTGTFPEARLTNLQFWGFPGETGFPHAYITKFTLAFSSSSSNDCVAFFMGPETTPAQNQPSGVTLCADGFWSSEYAAPNSLSAYGALSAPFHVQVTMTGASMALSVDGKTVIPAAAYVGQVNSMVWEYLTGTAGHTFSVSDFSITPTA